MTRFLPAILLLGCTPPSESRAEADDLVGRAGIAGIDVEVAEGHAAVRVLEPGVRGVPAKPGRLQLWCSVPEPRVRLHTDEDGDWEIALDNAMPDAALVATAEDGAPLVVTEVPSGIPTRRRLTVSVRRGDNTLALRTPDTDDRAVWRFALLSDVQDAIDEVQDIFGAINREPGVRFLLGAGDLVQDGSLEEMERFQRELERLHVPYYTTIGNHDAPPKTDWHALYGRGSFRFVFRGVQFTMLDSASATIDPLAYRWLEGWLDEGLSRVNVFAMHMPALDPVGVRNGAFGSRNEAGKLLAMLQQANVALTLYGHIHSFYQFENAGIPALISGGGGALPERLEDYERHYMLIDVGADAGVVATARIEVD